MFATSDDLPDDDRITIDELAQQSGQTTRNIRAFQTEGMLPGPALHGRTGYYSSSHLARLTLINDLQAQGYSRAAIASLLQAWERGRSLADLLGVQEAMPAVLEPDKHMRTSLESFRARMNYSETVIAEAVALRLARIDGDEVEILNPALFEIGREFALAGVSLTTIMQQARRLREAADNIALHYVDLLMAQVSDSQGVADGDPLTGEDSDVYLEMLQRLSPLVAQSVDAALRQSMNDQLRELLGAMGTTYPRTQPHTNG